MAFIRVFITLTQIISTSYISCQRDGEDSDGEGQRHGTRYDSLRQYHDNRDFLLQRHSDDTPVYVPALRQRNIRALEGCSQSFLVRFARLQRVLGGEQLAWVDVEKVFNVRVLFFTVVSGAYLTRSYDPRKTPMPIRLWFDKAPMVFLIIAAVAFVIGLNLFAYLSVQVCHEQFLSPNSIDKAR